MSHLIQRNRGNDTEKSSSRLYFSLVLKVSWGLGSRLSAPGRGSGEETSLSTESWRSRPHCQAQAAVQKPVHLGVATIDAKAGLC